MPNGLHKKKSGAAAKRADSLVGRLIIKESTSKGSAKKKSSSKASSSKGRSKR